MSKSMSRFAAGLLLVAPIALTGCEGEAAKPTTTPATTAAPSAPGKEATAPIAKDAAPAKPAAK